MGESIRDLEANVHAVFSRALTLANSAKSQRFAEVERSLWTTMLELGRALVAVFLSQQAARLRPRSYMHDGVAYELDVRKQRAGDVVMSALDSGESASRVPSVDVVDGGLVVRSTCLSIASWDCAVPSRSTR